MNGWNFYCVKAVRRKVIIKYVPQRERIASGFGNANNEKSIDTLWAKMNVTLTVHK